VKGDYVQVTYRTPAGATVEKIQATKDGSRIDVVMPGRNESFIAVVVLNKAGDPTSTSRFAATEVLAIKDGHEMLARTKAKRA